MKTTLDLPDELMREVKIRAVMEDRKLKDLIPDLLQRGLQKTESEKPPPKKLTGQEWIEKWQELGRRIEAASPNKASGVVDEIREGRERC